MPASTELLVEQIEQLQRALFEAEDRNEDTAAIRAELQRLSAKLRSASDALNESKLLKS